MNQGICLGSPIHSSREAPQAVAELPRWLPTVTVQLSRYMEPLSSPGFRGRLCVVHAWQQLVRSSLSISRSSRGPGPSVTEAASEVSGLNLASLPNRTAGASSHRPCGTGVVVVLVAAVDNVSYRAIKSTIHLEKTLPVPAHHHTLIASHTRPLPTPMSEPPAARYMP